MTKETGGSAKSGVLAGTAALTMLLGLQLLRALMPYLMYLLRERRGWSTVNVGVFALTLFLTSFLAGPLNRLLGGKKVAIAAGVLVGLSRLAVQLWTGDPLGDLVLTAAGVAAFLVFLPTIVGKGTAEGDSGGTVLGLGFLVGMTLDLALNGALRTYDLIWQSGAWPLVLTAISILLQMWLLLRYWSQESDEAASDVKFSPALSWAMFGPYSFLELLIFANIAWAASQSGWSFAAAFFWLLLAHVVSIGVWLAPASYIRTLLIVCWPAVFIMQLLLLVGKDAAWITAVYLLIGQLALAGTLVAILSYLGSVERRPDLRNLSTAGGMSMIIFVALLFAYYAAYDIALPFSNEILPLAALILAALLGFRSLARSWRNWEAGQQRFATIVTVVALVTLLVPISLLFTSKRQVPNAAPRDTLRVMTFNLHNGFDTLGQLDLERIAQDIEDQNPDVIGLQEVSRGWVINGSADMVVWLAGRLGMEPVYGPTVGKQWGNAVLTGVPILDYVNVPLPTAELLLTRGYQDIHLMAPDGSAFNLINTHYHNPAEGGQVRVLQSEAILEHIQDSPRTILMGDLNAEHGMPEIDILAGSLVDVLTAAGVEPGYTNPWPDPTRRIDFIFVTPDWQVQSASVPPSQASDHLPVAGELSNGG